MSGLRNTEPTAGTAPPGRKTLAVAGNFANRSAFEAVWSWNVWSTTKPRRAMFSAGASRSPRGRVPKDRAARSQVAGEPGTPTDSPELTALENAMGVPSGSRKVVGVKVLGAVSRPSMVFT